MGCGYVQHHDGELVWLEYYWEQQHYLPTERDSFGEWTLVGGPTWTQKPYKSTTETTKLLDLVDAAVDVTQIDLELMLKKETT